MQQDNNPKYTSKSTKKWLKHRKCNILEWLCQNPKHNFNTNIVKGKKRKKEQFMQGSLLTSLRCSSFVIPPNCWAELIISFQKH